MSPWPKFYLVLKTWRAMVKVATLLRGSVRMKFTLSKLRLGSPPRFPKTQSSIARVKTPHLEVFFISLESY
jgi:hypothetical protein